MVQDDKFTTHCFLELCWREFCFENSCSNFFFSLSLYLLFSYSCTLILGLGDSSDSAIIIVIRVTITIAIAKNYYRDSGHVVIRMRSQNCHTSTSHVKKCAKMANNSGDCGEIVLDEELEVLSLEG